ncbi:MAG: pilus assembly protein PilM [Bdellovibrionales bacterium]
MMSVGVDIGSYSIKVAEVESTSKSYVIRRVFEFPLSLDLTKDKKIEIIDTLRTLFQQYDFERTHFVFAVPQKSVSLRLLNFPFRERFKVQRATASQLEDDLPFSQEDAVFDTKIVRYSGKSADVLAMAVPKERVADVLGLANDCGVQPHIVSAESIGLANLFERWSDPPPEIPPVTQEIPAPRAGEIVLNIGHLTSQLMVYAEGMMIAVRPIDWGAKNMADAIAAKYSLNYIQAMRELQLKGFLLLEKGQGTKEQLMFSQTIEKSVQDLVSLMRLKMLELQSELNLQWSKALMLGGGSQLKNLGAYLTQSFEIPFNRYKQFEHHPAVSFETNSQIEATCGVAVGLAIEALKRPRNPATNFLKGEFAQQSDFIKSLWERWGYTAQLAGAAFLILMVYGITRDSLSVRLLEESDRVLKMQAEAIAGLKGKRAGIENVRKFINNIDKETKNRKQAEKVTHINSALDILNVVSAALPPGAQLPLEIKRVQIDNETAEIHGYTNGPADVGRIQQVLQKLSQNGKADVVPLKIPPPPGKTGFAFKIHVNRFSGG